MPEHSFGGNRVPCSCRELEVPPEAAVESVSERGLERGGAQPYCQLGPGTRQSLAECPGVQNRLVDHPLRPEV